MERRSQWMEIPRPFPSRFRCALMRWEVCFMLHPWRALALSAALSLALAPLAWLVWQSCR